MIEPSISPGQNCSWFGFDILPLFHEKAATPEMIRRGMELMKKMAVDLSPTQIPVMTVDQPLYDQAKNSISGPSLNFLE